MKKDYNRDVMSDMPVDNSFTPPTTRSAKTQTPKPKINSIGKRGTAKTQKSEPVKKSSSTTKKADETKKQTKESSSLRTKLVGSSDSIKDLEKLNEENIKTHQLKSKRSKVVIALLSVLLAISIVTVVAYMSISNLKANCKMIIHGDVDAVYLVEGVQMSEFRTPSNLQGNSRLEVDIKITIKEDEYYSIKFTPKVYQKGVLIENTLVYQHNTDLFYDGGDGYYYSINPIRGNQTISLCEGIIFDYYYKDSLNIDNFRMEFHTYFEKV